MGILALWIFPAGCPCSYLLLVWTREKVLIYARSSSVSSKGCSLETPPFVAPQEYPVPVLKESPWRGRFSPSYCLHLPCSTPSSSMSLLHEPPPHRFRIPHIGGVCPSNFAYTEIQSLPPGNMVLNVHLSHTLSPISITLTMTALPPFHACTEIY